MMITTSSKGGIRVKLTVEYVSESEPEEIVWRTHAKNDDPRLREQLLRLISDNNDLALTLGDTEYYVPIRDILFFETADGKITAHTAKKMYYTSCKLYELEGLLPPSFIRASKSCIVNSAVISSLSHNLTGASRVTFRATEKIVYVSRSYYKLLKDKIYEMRILTEQGAERRT